MQADSFTDIHSHILPGADDGSGSMEQTLKMLLIAKQQRIKTIIATPHYVCGANNKQVARLLEIKEQVQKEAVKFDREFRIFLGNELYYSEDILEALNTGKALTLAGSRYALIEFPAGETYQTLYRGLGEFILAGYAPILAHVERYRCLKEEEERIEEIIKLGAYIQINSGSLLGGFLNREAAYHRKLVKKGLIHFIASDCHDTDYRPPQMEDTFKTVLKCIDNRLVNQIFLDNPAKILENKYI